jgi:hypothetical protein
MKAAQDAAKDDITKEVWNDLSGKFSLSRQVGYGISNSRVKNTGIPRLVPFFGPQATTLFEKPH